MFVLMTAVAICIPTYRHVMQWRQRQRVIAAVEKSFVEAHEHNLPHCIQYLKMTQQIVESAPALQRADRERLTRLIALEISRLQVRFEREWGEERRLTSCAIPIADDDPILLDCSEFGFPR
jgi:hypothetical protein